MTTAAGSNRQIQFNSDGNLSASDYLTFDSNNQLVLGNNAPLNRVPTDGYRSQIAFKKYKADGLSAFGVKLARSDPSQPHLAIIDSQVEQLQLNNGGFYITRRRASALTLNTASFDPRYADGSLFEGQPYKTSYTDAKPYDTVFGVSMYEPRDVPNAQVGDVNVIPSGLETSGWYNLLAVSRQGDLTVAIGQIRTNNDISTFNGNVYASNQLLGGNLRVPGFARFSTAGNVYIPGGTIGQILACDDINGKLKWINNSSAPIKVKDEGALITPEATEFNFVGTGVTATSSLAGAVTVTIPSTAVAVADEGTSLTSTATRLNFVGSGVTATATAGNVTINIPGAVASNIVVQDEGATLTNAVSKFNFVGTGVTATNSGSNVTVTIPGGSGIAVQDEGANVVASANTVNFVGAGVTASNVGGVATVTIPGSSYALAVKDEGNTVAATANVINFVGTGVTATQASANNVTVTINSSSLTTQDEGVNIANATTKFNFVGAGVTATGVGQTDVTVNIPGNSVKVLDAAGNVITNNLKELRFNAALVSTGNVPDTGVVTVSAPAGSGGMPVAVSNKNTLLTSAVTGINFLGSGVSAAITSGNNISVTVPGFSGITVQDEGSIVSSSALQFNFVGTGITATGSGSNITVSVPGETPLVTKDEGNTVVANTTTLNFVGSGVTASNVGNVATITVPGRIPLVTKDEGTTVVADTTTINFVGAGVTATSVGGVATVNISGSGAAGGLPGYLRTYTGNATTVTYDIFTWYPLPLDSSPIFNTIGAIDYPNGVTQLPAGTYYYETTVGVTNNGSDGIASVYTSIVENTSISLTGIPGIGYLADSTQVVYDPHNEEIVGAEIGVPLVKGATMRLGDWQTGTLVAVGKFTITSTKNISVAYAQTVDSFPQARVYGNIDNHNMGYTTTILKLWKLA